MTRVVIVQRRMTHYRLPLFEMLRDRLQQRGILLDVLAGCGTPEEETKRDSGLLPWSKPLPTHYFGNGRFCWQPLRKYLDDANLVIVTQENKLLYNHLLMVMPRCFKLAFWGHGANLQSSDRHGFKERFKRWTTNQVDWWFAYTQTSADLVASAGFPAHRITVLNNTVDTALMLRQRKSITLEEAQALRHSLGLGTGPTGIFVGSLYADKKLDFLFAAAAAIRRQVPDFRLLIVGDGPEREKVRAWCAINPWSHWAGPCFGRDKIACLSLAQLMLNPGALGLGVMDAFACQVPIVTTACGKHGPEISYLDQGGNALITADGDLPAYVGACVGLLESTNALQALREGCAASAKKYTLDNMANRFAEGITNCLQAA